MTLTIRQEFRLVPATTNDTTPPDERQTLRASDGSLYDGIHSEAEARVLRDILADEHDVHTTILARWVSDWEEVH